MSQGFENLLSNAAHHKLKIHAVNRERDSHVEGTSLMKTMSYIDSEFVLKR